MIEMTLIKNPCGTCSRYSAQLAQYAKAVLEDGSAEALRGAYTIFELMLEEPEDQEIAGLLKRHSDICPKETAFCTYKKAAIKELRDLAKQADELSAGIDPETRDELSKKAAHLTAEYFRQTKDR